MSPLLLILLFALGLRLLLWSQPLHQPANDEIEYITVARDLLAGRGWQFYDRFEWLRAPLYPLFLAGSLRLASGAASPDTARALDLAALPNILLSTANVYLSYRLTLALAGRRAGLLAALLTAVLWTNITFAGLYMSETLFTFLFSAGLLGLLQMTTPRLPDRGVVRAYAPVLLAGLCFGLAALTRSAVLIFLPFVVLWLLINQGHRLLKKKLCCSFWRLRRQNEQQKMFLWRGEARPHLPTGSNWLAALVFALAVMGTIAPWTIRNYLAYGRPILVETGLAYNLWLFNEPRESKEEISRTLVSIANPAERADYAVARGTERLREDPAILVRKLWPNWVYLVRVKPIQDRFLMEDYRSDVPLPFFAAALVFDDVLYLLIGLAAIAGLAYCRSAGAQEAGRPGDRETGARGQEQENQEAGEYADASMRSPRRAAGAWPFLAVAWIGVFLVTVLLTHGEARYRHFLFPVLIPYAAVGILDWGRSQSTVRHLRLRIVAMLTLSAALLYPLLASYPWGWAGRNLDGGRYTLAGDIAWARGDHAVAIRAYERAIDAHETPDAWLRLGEAARAVGDEQRAEMAYRQALDRAPSYPPAHARLGDLLRSKGNAAAAREVFSAAPQQPLTVWAWRELHTPPPAALDIGGGLDDGFVSGVYPPETQQGATARWTDGRGLIRLAHAGAVSEESGAIVRVRLAAPHPGGAPVPVQVCLAAICRTFEAGPTWRTYVVAFEQAPAGRAVITIGSPTFTDVNARPLGVLLDRAAIASLRE